MSRYRPSGIRHVDGAKLDRGSGMERENLAGDVKGNGANGSHREAESTDAPERGGLPRSSEERSAMEPERTGWVTAVELGQSATG